MIPLKLHIKNFLSYGSELQTIDFAAHHLICLSGKNGHGKSALLDAITWALWGVARKIATSVKPDLGLLRLGQQQMLVILDFSLGEHTYRIRRELSFMYGKAHTTLDFGMINPLTQKLVPLTDKTIKDTQRIIEETINIDFETFTNSAFLKQGQSNEFSKKSAKERKDILATILGLDQYDMLKKKALEKIRQAQEHDKTLAAFQERITTELQKKNTLANEIAATEQALATNTHKEADLKQKLVTLEQQHKLLAQRIQKYNQLSYQKEQLEASSGKETELLLTLRKQWRLVHSKQQLRINAQQLHETQEQLNTILKIHQQKLQKSFELKEELIKHKEVLQKQISVIQHDCTVAQMQAHMEHEQHLHAINNELRNTQETRNQLQELLVHLSALEKQQEELALLTQMLPSLTTAYAQADLFFERRKSFYQKYSAHGNMLHQKIKSLAQKQELVTDGDQAACPLCEQNLSASRRRFLHQQFSAEYALTVHQYQRMVRIIGALKPQLVDDHAQLAQRKKEIEKCSFSLLQKEELEKQITNLRQQQQAAIAKQEISEKNYAALKEITAKQQAIRQPDFKDVVKNDALCQKQQQCIDDLEKMIVDNNYCKQTHKKDQQALDDLQNKLKEINKIQQELLEQADRKKTIISQCSLIKNLRLQMKTINDELLPYADITTIESNLTAERQIVESSANDVSLEKNNLVEQKGRLLNEQQKLLSLETELQQYSQERQELGQTMQDYTFIAQATGKDGIQALLIEEAIPEVEHEANMLLSKLTNNQAQISIESLRDLKKGGTKETLDIKISDTTGCRPYELFSGGEAFRIDFALRIAISKLLARRAGTALQTLIIDEGFGSQDDEGLANIMDALYKIQDDFAKIIVVSHLDALKEQFPVHFVVQKTAQGSSVTVIEHG